MHVLANSAGTGTCTWRRIMKILVVASLFICALVAAYIVLRPSTHRTSFSSSSPAVRMSTISDGNANSKKARQDYTSWLRFHEQTGNTSQSLTLNGDLRRRPPDFIVIGARKCGTRALLVMLNIHPRVVAGGPEVHYFDRDNNYQRGLRWYVNHMKLSSVGQLTGEKSPSYFITHGVPQRIKNYSRTVGKDVKLLLIVRDPVDRVVSDYTQGLTKRKLSISKTRQIQEDFRGHALLRSGEVNEDWSAVRIGRYSDHLARWYQTFRKEQIHIVNGDTLIANPVKEMKKVKYDDYVYTQLLKNIVLVCW